MRRRAKVLVSGWEGVGDARRVKRVDVLVVVLLLFAAGCVSGSEGGGAARGAPTPSVSSRGDAVPDGGRTWFEAGTPLTIFGIRGQLNARASPGTGSRVVRRLYIDEEIVATGTVRWVGDRWWAEVELPNGDATAWVARQLVGVAGSTEDIASDIPARDHALLGADVLDLGQRALRALDVTPEGVGTVLSQVPLIQQRATVAFDVKDADPATLGDRIRVIGVPVDAPGGRFELERVERTPVCARAVAADGACAPTGGAAG